MASYQVTNISSIKKLYLIYSNHVFNYIVYRLFKIYPIFSNISMIFY